MLTVDQPGTLQRIGSVHLGEIFRSDNGHTPSISELAYLHNHPEHPMREMVPSYCSQGCGAQFTVMKYFASVTSCTECRDKKIEADAVERHREQWEAICPKLYRNTSKDHPEFAKAQFEGLKDYRGERSLIFFGPSRTGKTRLAFFLLKRCLHLGNKRVGVMFDEDLSAAKSNRERRLEVEKWGRFDILLLDDALMNGAQDEHTTAFLKSLLDYIMREERAVIITSQITLSEYRSQLSKYATDKKQTTAADSERTTALLQRIKEMTGEPIEFHGKPGETPRAPNAGPAPDLF